MDGVVMAFDILGQRIAALQAELAEERRVRLQAERELGTLQHQLIHQDMQPPPAPLEQYADDAAT